MSLEEQVLSSESSPFTIRRFVSKVRGKDFSKCWPFPHRILERCLILGMKVELPPLEGSVESTLNGHVCGRCNISTQLPLNVRSDSIVSCSFCHRSSKEDLRNFDSKDSVKASRDPAMEKKLFCDAEDLTMVVEKVGVNMQEQFLSTQKPDRAAEVKALTENLWDNNTVDCKPDIISNSASQLVVGTLPDNHGSTNLAGLDTKSTPETLLLKHDIVRDCGPHLAVHEESCSRIHKSYSPKPAVLCDTFSELLNEGVAESLQHSSCPTTDHDSHHGIVESPKAVLKPAILLNASEPIGYLRRAERNKNAQNFGLLKSSSEASMLQVCPVCLKFSSTSNTALNAHIDHCLILDKSDAARTSKKRFKLKKMRSMVDIYASAPVRTLKDLEMSSQIWSLQKVNRRVTRSGI